MFVINNEVDLGRSFEKLKDALDESEKVDQKPLGTYQAYVNLRQAVMQHLKACTEDSADDLPKELFKQ